MNYFTVQQKLTQHCKSTTLQLKKKIFQSTKLGEKITHFIFSL